jgi:RimJ/RimL family protein N-acetyltransferase
VSARIDAKRVRLAVCALDDPVLRERFVAFFSTQNFPLHLRTTWTREEIEQRIASGAYDDCDVRGVVVDDATVGFVVIEGATQSVAMLDLRLADDWRNRGVGTHALRLASDHVFTDLPAERLEGVTREDNVAMRHVFRSCGFVLESYYRSGWAVHPPLASLGYARLKADWERDVVTPVPWDEVLAQEFGKRPE